MDNVRIEQLLGNKKVIVGTKYNDLVLETLGKVYIKSGNNFKLLTELIETLNKSDSKNILIVSSITEMESMKYPGDGYFVFSSLNKALYISYDNRYIKLIEIDEEEKPDYVKKSGDTMTGPLEIDTTSAPLIVASSELIKNLNSEQVGGYKAEDLAKIRKDEIIYGLWTFKNPGVSEDLWTFNKNIDIKGDIILKGSLGSPSFASGFGGYGWRFDADTNTLTVDYLVVRKAMNVYELVVNQITATNGSLWVSNSTTIEEVEQPLIVTVNQLNYFEQDESNSQVGWQGTDLQKERFKALFFENKYYLITDDVIGDTLSTNGDTKGREDQSPQDNSIVKETTSLSTSSTINNTEKTFVNYKYLIRITDIDGLLNSPNFQGKSTFLSESSLKNLSDFIKFTYISKKVYDNTYIETFDKDCGFYARVQNTKIKIKSYYKYYALKKETIQSAIDACVEYFNNTHNKSLNYTVPSFYIITSKDYTYFKPGDVIRCQKFQDNNIKYYDAIVLAQIADKSVIIQKADSVFDQYTEVEYVDGNKTQYTTTYSDMAYNNGEKAYDVTTDSDIYLEGFETEEERLNSRLAEPAIEDDVVQMGNIYDPKRQNAIYITSTDDQSPYIDIIGDVNRPDYSVLYEVPVFKRESYVNTTVDNGYRGVRYNYYLLSPTTENSKIQNVVPIYIDQKLTYYGTTTPMDNSLIEQVNGQDHYEYTCTTKVRVGKLDGITNYMFKDKQPYGYGLYGENVFLTGEFYLNNGQSVVDFSKDYIDLKVETINADLSELQAAVDKAQDTADAATITANAAKNDLTNFKSDGIISPTEKTSLRQQLADINAEYTQIINDANKYGLSTSTYTTAYNNAKAALQKYTQTSPEFITIGSDYNNISAYYSYRQTLLNSITQAAKSQVDDINSGLLATGINIQDRLITITSDKLIIQSNSGAENIGSIINGIDSDISKAQNTANQAQNTANSALTAAGNSETNAKNQIANKLGYGNFDNMVEQTSKNESTIIKGGYLNTSLIQAKAITADMINADGIKANNVDLTGKINAEEGELGTMIIKDGSAFYGIFYNGDNTELAMRPGNVMGIPYNVFIPSDTSNQGNILLYLKRRRNNYYDRSIYAEGISEFYGRVGIGKAPNTGFNQSLPALVTEGLSCYGQFCLPIKRITFSAVIDSASSYILLDFSSDEGYVVLPSINLTDGQTIFIRNVGNQVVKVVGTMRDETNSIIQSYFFRPIGRLQIHTYYSNEGYWLVNYLNN